LTRFIDFALPSSPGILASVDMEITQQLQRLESGERDVLDVVMPVVYDELKKLAHAHLRREVGVSRFQTTALVHEAFVKMVGGRQPSYESRAHFFGIASRLMRQILVDDARARATHKRSAQEVSLDEACGCGERPSRSLLALDDALRELEKRDALKAQIVEMRFFGGMTADETSTALSKPVHVIRRELRLAQAWLRREMSARPTLAPGLEW
jgi:RNA polymerase sigma factor (TIGR02999 family)